MSRHWAVAILILSAVACATNSHVDPAADFDQADQAMSRLDTWHDLSTWQKRFGRHDHGYIAEGISDFVVQKLAKDWGSLPELADQLERNPMLLPLVIRHIDATTSWDDLKQIVAFASANHNARFQVLCEQIGTEATAALRDAQAQ